MSKVKGSNFDPIIQTMTNKMKKIFILTSLIILLCLFGVYFLFPGVMFDLLKTAERSAAGLKQHSVYVKGFVLNIWKEEKVMQLCCSRSARFRGNQSCP